MIFVDAALRKPTPYTPTWLMRQAGRYLSEYKATRAKAGSFLDLCQNVALATEVTLQPIEILDVDAAILFSDILVVPLAMGLELEFVAGEGPRFLSTARDTLSINALKVGAYQNLNYVYDTISSVRAKLAKDKALIGFCGAPWTLATYMIEGEGSKSYAHSKKMLYSDPNLLHSLLGKITQELIGYLDMQIKAGANAVQIFDSWAGALSPRAYVEFGWRYMLEIAKALRQKHRNIPIMLFPKGVGAFLEELRHEADIYGSGFDVFGVDWGVSMSRAKQILGDKYVLQGNLEPAALYSYAAMEEGVDEILRVMGNREGHIFNLGHGMMPDLPRENAIKLVQMIKDKTKR
ncbi:uroporphyrinogen decarboxylase [Helicobacter sp. CLO-3]|uniref:uroporphyrinogen decarboxylase n=1 Tax=unclassified Helicobacter TaxID=2593540 RepID=UPI0008052A9B|nr:MULTISPECIES: uroporphyrinogen decarboxylase [unclassified Helicobacter]OBV28877.1 uroporphyrinogen decarboxylase [Helicobacter sp. CLO-3]OHU84131.1 uroporphyrinogen decarboxylase [Helicobacter sp. CLO-3]